MCTGLKKTPAEVGAIDWPDVLDQLSYWRDWPPEHVSTRLVAQRLGMLPAPSEVAQPKRYATRDEVLALGQAMAGMNGGG